MEERIKRINELYHKSQAGPLSDAEKEEQTRLRKEYIASVRGSLRSQLNNIDIKESDGSITNLGEKFGKAGEGSESASSAENIRKQKSLLRKQILEKRNQMKNSEVIDKSKVICKKVAALDEYKKSRTVLLYYPYNNEVETFSLAEMALSEGKTVAFPKSELVDGKPNLDFYIVDNLDHFVNGYKGIMEPDTFNFEPEKFMENADLCIVPGVVFSADGARIGYGKGFYDRYLTDNAPGTVIGIGFENQIVPEIGSEDTDVKMNIVVTEKNIYR